MNETLNNTENPPCFIPAVTSSVFCSDNLELLKSQPNESVNMIYSDILYGTGKNFGEYQDLKPIRSETESHYLPRLIEMHRVLKQNGCIYLQMDTRINHWMRILMDEVFGYDNFRNEIVWCYKSGGISKTEYPKKHDVILLYSKTNIMLYNPQMKPYSEKTLQRGLTKCKGGYKLNNDGTPQVDWIDDTTPLLSPTCYERTGYPTQKPKELISRFILAFTNEGDVVADYYLGSGTTAVVCKELNRIFIGCDLSLKAIEITKNRLDAVR